MGYKENMFSYEVLKSHFKLVFNDSIIIYYKDLEPKGEIQTTTQFDNKKISDKTDYKLKKLTDDEMSKIKK